MIQIPQDFLDFIQLLNKNEVDYLIVGGYAVAIHGYVRYTGDIDFFIALNSESARRMVRVFQEFGLNAPELDEKTNPRWTRHNCSLESQARGTGIIQPPLSPRRMAAHRAFLD